jgi:hypothetical protein
MVGREADTSAVSGMFDHTVSTEVPLVIDESPPFEDVLVPFSRNLRVISDRTATVTYQRAKDLAATGYNAVDRLICQMVKLLATAPRGYRIRD